MYLESLTDVNNGKKNWASNVKRLLYTYGFGYIWEMQDSVTDGNLFIQCFKQRVIDCFLQNWRGEIDTSDKLVVYKHVKFDFGYEKYLDLLSKSQRHYVTKLRTSTIASVLKQGGMVITEWIEPIDFARCVILGRLKMNTTSFLGVPNIEHLENVIFRILYFSAKYVQTCSVVTIK